MILFFPVIKVHISAKHVIYGNKYLSDKSDTDLSGAFTLSFLFIKSVKLNAATAKMAYALYENRQRVMSGMLVDFPYLCAVP